MRDKNNYITGILIFCAAAIFIPMFIIDYQLSKAGHIQAVIINTALFFLSSEITDKYKLKSGYGRYGYLTAPFFKSVFIHLTFIWIISMVFPASYKMTRLFYFVTIVSCFLEIVLISVKYFNMKIHQAVSGNKYAMGEIFASNKKGNEVKLTEDEISRICRVFTGDEKEIITKLFEGCRLSSEYKIKSETGNGKEKNIIYDAFQTINDKREPNVFFNECNNNLESGGFFVARYELFNKISPVKISGKILSRAEIWGRLHYCGFDVLSECTKGNYTYILSQKTGPPAAGNIKYPLLIRLKRVGYQGRLFYLFKLRSMYPYSEFIQKKLQEINELNGAGKINSDFRITPAGKFIRKYWIDELPQFINWLKSDIKLVGIRAMSVHYFMLYPDYYKEKYLNVKPGLIPPVFDGLEKDFSVIVETELKYLNEYLEKPFFADIKLLLNTAKSIFVKGYRGR